MKVGLVTLKKNTSSMLSITEITNKLTEIERSKNECSISENIYKQLTFIAEVDKIKQIFRRTLLTDSSRQENDAEHSWHLALMAILLEEYASEPVDMKRVLKMVIIHDLVEIYAGDTFAFDEKGNQNKVEREIAAADKLFTLLNNQQGDELKELWQEFDAMDTADSKFAASLDRLQPFIHNVLTDGYTWKLGKVSKNQVYKRMEIVQTACPRLWPWVQGQIQLAIEKGYINK